MNREDLVAWLREGCRKNLQGTQLGIELERFIVDPVTQRAVPYYGERGVEEILLALMEEENKGARRVTSKTMSEGHCIGYETADYSITLEPAAQLEISARPVCDVFAYRDIYEAFEERLLRVLKRFGWEIAAYGYQPASRVDDLAIIPKERYRLMDAAFKTIGHYGRCMMRGTASTQISVDYADEEDFARKYRLAYALRTVFADLCDNMPVFEGAPNTKPHMRLEIWQHVDPARDDVHQYMTEGGMTFDAYADFVLHAPQIVPAGEENEVEHALSMVFPDVRAKHYIEIRVGDSMPLKGIMAYGIVVRTLFSDVRAAEDFLCSRGFSGALRGEAADQREAGDRAETENQADGQAALRTAVLEYVYSACTAREREFLDGHYRDFTHLEHFVRQ